MKLRTYIFLLILIPLLIVTVYQVVGQGAVMDEIQTQRELITFRAHEVEHTTNLRYFFTKNVALCREVRLELVLNPENAPLEKLKEYRAMLNQVFTEIDQLKRLHIGQTSEVELRHIKIIGEMETELGNLRDLHDKKIKNVIGLPPNEFKTALETWSTEVTPVEEALLQKVTLYIQDAFQLAHDSGKAMQKTEEAGLNSLFVMSFFIFIIFVFVAFVIDSLISRPIRKLARSFQDISNCKFDVQLGKSNITEVQDLLDSLAKILASLKLAVLRTKNGGGGAAVAKLPKRK